MAVRQGDEAALNELIGRKTKPLLQLCQRILGDAEEARDVVQVTFFKVWENRRKFDDRWSPNTWIYRIASNLAIDHLRSRRSRERSHEPVRQHLRQVADGRAHRDLSRLQQTEVATIFRELSAGLSEKQRMVFLLRELEGLSSPEVAEILGCRESTVRNHLFNARKYLRRELLRRYPEYAGGFGLASEEGWRSSAVSCPDWSRLAAARDAGKPPSPRVGPRPWRTSTPAPSAAGGPGGRSTAGLPPAAGGGDHRRPRSAGGRVDAPGGRRHAHGPAAGDRGGRFAGWRRWAAAAVLAVASLGVGRDKTPQLEQVADAQAVSAAAAAGCGVRGIRATHAVPRRARPVPKPASIRWTAKTCPSSCHRPSFDESLDV